MSKLPLISKDLFCSVDYSKFTDYNSGWKEAIPLREHFKTTYKVPKIKGSGARYYLRYWEDIFTHFPFIPSCRINVMLNNITHRYLLFKGD